VVVCELVSDRRVEEGGEFIRIGGAAGRVVGCGSGRGRLMYLSGTQTRRESCDEKEEDEH
jgi:hypothetical protein